MIELVKTDKRSLNWVILVSLVALAGCQNTAEIRSERPNDVIMIAGELFHTMTKVVLWTDKGGFDAYRGHRHDQKNVGPPHDHPDRLLRFGSLRRNGSQAWKDRVQREGYTPEDLIEVIDTIVLHYDACGSSSRCFHVLHDLRGLSCHFLIDVDGTIYQTLDVKERAWHAGTANDRSIGIEIAHFGAFPEAIQADLHYEESTHGIRLKESSLAGTSAEGAFPYPARQQMFSGVIHQQNLFQRDFTEAQYASIEKLLIALCRAIPSIRPIVPRTEEGFVQSGLRPEPSGQAVAGIVGHWHVGSHKVDPGPAFNWDRIESALRASDINNDGLTKRPLP